MSNKVKTLRSLRAAVGAVDHELMRLLAHRQQLVQEIGLIKTRRQLPIARLDLEKKIIASWRRRAKSLGLSETLAARFINLILRDSRSLQRRAVTRAAKS